MSIWEALGKTFGMLEKNAGKVAIGLGGTTVGAIAGASAASPGVEINSQQGNIKNDDNPYLGAIIIVLIILALAFGFYYLKKN
ncbi:hypothetical protein ACO3VM_09410 (plasmid) [Methanocaldococcus sp. 10A]